MPFLVAIPGAIAAVLAFARSSQRAFLDVYLPVVLFLPDYYRWFLPGLPDPTFNQAAIVPIAVAALLQHAGKWRFSWTDLLVFGFSFFVGYSEWTNAGYSEAQNLMFDMLASVLMPYACAKLLIEPLGLRFAFARRVVAVLALVSIVSLFEFRFGMTPFRIVFDRFFPGQGVEWVTTFRWGFARVAGPYGHAILAGIILVTGYRIQRWLQWSGAWEPQFTFLPGPPKAMVLTLALAGGIVMTMVRGPWIGAAAATLLTGIGRARNRRLAARSAAAAVLLIGIPAGAMLYSYASVGRAHAKSDSQETAAYRKELIDKYVDIAVRRSALGWGRNTWPRVDGMPSIDNYYLLLTLMHGLIALAFFLAIFLWMMARLFRRGMAYPSSLPRGGSLAFTLFGIYGALAISLATVYMGTQVIPLFALVTGWSEGYLLYSRETAEEEEHEVVEAPLYRFRRVVT